MSVRRPQAALRVGEMRRGKGLGVVAGLAFISAGPLPSRALDYQPFDYVPAEPGKSLLLGYYEYGKHNAYSNYLTGTVTQDTNLESNIGILRYLYYNTVFGHPYNIDLIVPFGTLFDAQIGGQQLQSTSGVADPLASLGFWFISDPEEQRYLAAAIFVSLPIGSYDKTRTLNLGGNRWQTDLQVDLTQGFLEKFTIDLSADWISYGNNDKAGTGSQSLTQRATYGTYAWLSYDVTSTLRTTGPASLAIGYSGTFGGVQKLDGVPTGAKTEEQQIRISYSQFVAPTWQAILSVSHDVSATGQFRQNFGLLLRVSTLF